MPMTKLENAQREQGSALIFRGENLHKLRISPNVCRWLPKGGETDQAHVLMLALDIAENGQTDRVIVRECEEEVGGEVLTYFETLAGRHRTEAVQLITKEPSRFKLTEKEAGVFPLLATQVKTDDAGAMRYSQNDNEGLLIGPMDYYKLATLHSEKFKLTQSEIASVMKKSQPWVGKILLLGKLTEYLQFILHQGKITRDLCFLIVTAGMYTPEKIRKMSDEMEAGKMSPQDLKAAVNARRKDMRRSKALQENKVFAEKPAIAEVLGIIRLKDSVRSDMFLAFLKGDPEISEELFLTLFDDDPNAFKLVADEEKLDRIQATHDAEQAAAELADDPDESDESDQSDDSTDDASIVDSGITDDEIAAIQAQDFGSMDNL